MCLIGMTHFMVKVGQLLSTNHANNNSIFYPYRCLKNKTAIKVRSDLFPETEQVSKLEQTALLIVIPTTGIGKG